MNSAADSRGSKNEEKAGPFAQKDSSIPPGLPPSLQSEGPSWRCLVGRDTNLERRNCFNSYWEEPTPDPSQERRKRLNLAEGIQP